MIGLQECGPAPPRAPLVNSTSSTAANSSAATSGFVGRGGVRERTAQAVEYYNTHVHRAWNTAGLSSSSSILSNTNNNSSSSISRSSFNDRHNNNSTPASRRQPCGSSNSSFNPTTSPDHNHHQHHHHIYRSNSSLELLDHNGRPTTNNCSSPPTLKREYGSHGSIDVIDRPSPPGVGGGGGNLLNGESFFAMLQDYRPAVLGVIGTDQRSPGPSEYLRAKASCSSSADNSLLGGISDEDAILHQQQCHQHHYHHHQHYQHNNNINTTTTIPQSPKLRVKLPRFWQSSSVNTTNSASVNNNNNNNNSASVSGSNCGLSGNRRHHQQHAMDDSVVMTTSSSSSQCSVVWSAEAEEIARRRAFSHYDCQSLTTNLNYAVRLRRVLAKRRNTTTGASAASSMTTRSGTPDGAENTINNTNTSSSTGEEDYGDGQNNDLVQSCPFFRNEIGGEEERIVSLTRLQSIMHTPHGMTKKPLHRPPLAYGVAVLEYPPGETHWRHSTCPYQRLPRPIESVDQGALYYRKYFAGQEHQNWFGMDEQLGPVAISIRREKVIHSDSNQLSSSPLMQYQYRLILRTSELQTLRGAILEDAIPSIKASNNSKTLNIKEVLEYVAPEIQLSTLRLGIQSPQTEEELLNVDEQGLNNHYKVGIMYCKAGQSSEEDMYNNEEAGPAFTEFLETIGKRVRLKGFDKYKAGLDNKSDSTGLYSVYSQYQDCEIMFHVSTLLPFTPNNRQQLLRKRHIGNDIVTIVFQEPGALPFTPRGIRSQFQHVFVVVQAISPCTENTHYKMAVSRSRDVRVFGPPIKDGAVFPKGKTFAEFLLAKVVNAENAAHRSEKFVTMATRTRQEYLKDLVGKWSTSTPVDTGQKFMLFSSKKKDKIRPRFIPDACQRGAILWQVLLDDSGQSRQIECFLGISTDTLVLIEENSKQIVFVTPCKSILGWSAQTNGLRIYHHQGECTTVYMRDANGDRDELMEIMDRLKAVTQGVLAKELSLKRNIMGQLGFHVQPDGIVTLVESAGEAWHGGLRQNSRLVEICKVAVSTLTYDQMVDLLKTSLMVTLTVIPPLADGSPRKGCTLQNCKYNEGNFYEGDYENSLNAVNNPDDHTGSSSLTPSKSGRKAPQMQQAVPGNHRRVYERSFSPPRSSNSSGYGTGSSSKSFHGIQDGRFASNPEGTMTSSSSGHSGDEKWYDVFQEPEPPPPIPQKTPNSSSLRQNNASSSSSTHHLNNLMFPSSTPKRNNNNTNTNTNNSSQQHQMNQLSHSNSHNHFGSLGMGSGVGALTSGSGGGQQPIMHHNKIQVSHSLPLQHVNFTQPLTAAIHNNNSDYELYNKIENNTSINSKIGTLKQHQQQQFVLNENGQSRQQQVQQDLDYLVTRSPKVADYTTTLQQISQDFVRATNLDGGHSTDSSLSGDRYGVCGGGSEDELSNGSGGNVSPRSRRAARHLGNAANSNSSRNQSPRSVNGEAKLRPGVTSRSSNRNSANLSTSNNFQEELLRLINPDNIEAASLNETKMIPKDVVKSHSRENLNTNTTLSVRKTAQNNQPEVILTTARPATVISNASTTSSPLMTNEFLHHNKNSLMTSSCHGTLGNDSSTPIKQQQKSVVSLEEFPVPEDWPSLVDTATRVLMQVTTTSSTASNNNNNSSSLGNAVVTAGSGNDSNNGNVGDCQMKRDDDGGSGNCGTGVGTGGKTTVWDDEPAVDASMTSSISSSTSVPELQSHVSDLETRCQRETRRRLSLENEVRQLKEENRRLQDQAQAAVQQLRKFTEWFFKNVQRQ